MKLKVKKGSSVEVIAGADRGKKGAVIEVLPQSLMVKVQGVNMKTHFDKKDGILKSEGFFDYSNVRLVQQAAKAATRKSPKKSESKSA